MFYLPLLWRINQNDFTRWNRLYGHLGKLCVVAYSCTPATYENPRNRSLTLLNDTISVTSLHHLQQRWPFLPIVCAKHPSDLNCVKCTVVVFNSDRKKVIIIRLQFLPLTVRVYPTLFSKEYVPITPPVQISNKTMI